MKLQTLNFQHFARLSALRAFILCLVLALAAASLTACGKKGNPKPPGDKNTFSWVYVDANIRNECISLRGTLQGDYVNLEFIRLELEPTGNIDDCIGCPFRPLETEVFYASDVTLSETGEFTLLYCPEQKSHMYRWRLIAVNTYHTLPNVLTPVLTVEDPAGPLPWNYSILTLKKLICSGGCEADTRKRAAQRAFRSGRLGPERVR